MKIWINKAREAVCRQPLILVGIGIDQMRDYIHLGGTVLGAIAILPLGGPPFKAEERFPVLVLEGRTRHILDLVACDFSLTCKRCSGEIGGFLDRIDPGGEAVIASYLPLPLEVLKGRSAWAQNSSVTQNLENKKALHNILEGCLSGIPSEETYPPLDRGQWERLCERFGSKGLVIQKNGLSIGGTQTFICEEFENASAALSILEGEPLRITPLILGNSLNIMGLVIDEKRTIVLPPSLQILRRDHFGRPIYGGNSVKTSLTGKETHELMEQVRNFGKRLAEHEFYGPFGLDFIHTADGEFLFHDLNPRMNGVVDSLSLYLAEGPHEPLRVLLLSRMEWTANEIRAFEEYLLSRVRAHPVVRYFLSREYDTARTMENTPPEGLWTVDPENLQIRHIEAGRGKLDAIRGRTILLRPLLPPGLAVQPKDRVVLGDFYSSPELSSDLEERWGNSLPRRLFEIMAG